jgi:DNA-directed RNA polymerase specialized sigma24 family protein
MNKPNHYINNKDFHKALVERKVEVDKALSVGASKPQISDYIGSCFLKLANNIAHKSNFSRYPYREEMISDGIIDCMKYIDTFDTARENPFAYFTSAISNAFIRRIVKEKKQGYVKSMLLSKSTIDVHTLQEHDEDGEYVNAFREYMNIYNNFDGSIFEKKKKIESTEVKYSTLEEFLKALDE